MEADIAGNVGGGWLEKAPDRGARLLCRTLISPGPAGTAAVLTTQSDFGADGADGPGFRIRRNLVTNATTPTLSGKVYGPYLVPDKWKLLYDTTGGSATGFYNMQDAKLLDHAGNPVLYFPARPGVASVTGTDQFVNDVNPKSSPGRSIPTPLYNEYDNSQYVGDVSPNPNINLLPLTDMQFILGDRNLNGQIDPTEHTVTSEPYLLWTADPNETFGDTTTNQTGSATYGIQPKGLNADGTLPAGSACRAVCNFDLPADLVKG